MITVYSIYVGIAFVGNILDSWNVQGTIFGEDALEK